MFDVYSPTGAYMGRYMTGDAFAWKFDGYRIYPIGD